MAEHPPAWLEDGLADLAAALEWPGGSDAVEAACDALSSGQVAGPSRPRVGQLRRPLLVAAAIVLAVVLVLPGPRRAVADLFGLGSVSVRVVPSDLPGAGAVGPEPGVVAPEGERVALAEAAAADVELLAPDGVGAPAAVWITGSAGRTIVWLGYTPTPELPEVGASGLGLLVTLVPGDVGPLLEKQVRVGQAARVEVAGRPALWVEGPHELLTIDAAGRINADASRLSASALVVTVGDTTVRLEGDLDQAAAVRLAESLRPLA